MTFAFKPYDGISKLINNELQREAARNAVPERTVIPVIPSLANRIKKRQNAVNSLQAGVEWAAGAREVKREPLYYMQKCRDYLSKMDTMGWNRSYHQRLFHDDFLKACTRSFWKLEKPGQFARDHQKVLRVNQWDHIAQEILISTPRRYWA